MDTLTKYWWGNGKSPWQLWSRGTYYSHPWWENLLSENSPLYEDDNPTNIQYRIDPCGENLCPKCKAKNQLRKEMNPDGDGDMVISCWVCKLTNYFFFDKVLMRWINRAIDGLEHAANCDPLLSDNERRLIAIAKQQLAYHQNYREEHREQGRATSKRFYERHKEQHMAYSKNYMKEHSEVINRQARERRAAKKGVSVGATA